MREKRMLLRRNIELYLPFAALLIGLLIMAAGKPLVIQSSSPVPMPQMISGEYSFDNSNWFPLEPASELSALDGGLYLRGHFESPIYGNSRLYYYSNHIACEVFINGELYSIDSLLEMEKIGIPLQPSMCAKAWTFWYFKDDVPTDALVEIHLKNPHTFGNESAYRDFLSTMRCTPNDPSFFEKYLSGFERPLLALGIIFVIVGILLLGSALSCMVLRTPVNTILTKMGLLSLFTGGFFLFDMIDLNFWSDENMSLMKTETVSPMAKAIMCSMPFPLPIGDQRKPWSSGVNNGQ